MARPGRKLRQKYPRLALYIKLELGQVRRRKPNVWREFLRWSQMNDQLGARVTSFNEDGLPVVGLTDQPKVNGVYNPDRNPRVIRVSHQVAAAYEGGEPGADILVESTILHELVHFGNYLSTYGLDSRKLYRKQGKPGYIKQGGRLVEVGKQFERRAYGADVNYHNMRRIHGGHCGTCAARGTH